MRLYHGLGEQGKRGLYFMGTNAKFCGKQGGKEKIWGKENIRKQIYFRFWGNKPIYFRRAREHVPLGGPLL